MCHGQILVYPPPSNKSLAKTMKNKYGPRGLVLECMVSRSESMLGYKATE